MQSIIEKLQTHHFNRIRIGIGSPPLIKGTNNLNTISHVLGNISQEEKSILDQVFNRVIESLEQLNNPFSDPDLRTITLHLSPAIHAWP